MRFRLILRLLLAPWPGKDSRTPHSSVGHQVPFYAPGFSLGYEGVAQADGPGDWSFPQKGWPMFGHDPARSGRVV